MRTLRGTGNVTSILPPSRPVHAFGYTPVNLDASYTPPVLDATSPTTTTAYNTDRQLTLISRPDGQTLALGYDAGGRLSTLTQPRQTISLALPYGSQPFARHSRKS